MKGVTILLASFASTGAAIILQPAVTPTRVIMMSASKDGKDDKDGNDGDNRFLKFMRMAVTGSPDGVSLLGKPQIDWMTGKPLSKPRGYDWNASSKAKAGRDDNQKKKG
jgi:hypothetical protein